MEMALCISRRWVSGCNLDGRNDTPAKIALTANTLSDIALASGECQ
jgi:hypothetical protein